MYKLCWEHNGIKKQKSFRELEDIFRYLQNFVYNGEWVEHDGQKLDIDLRDYTANQISLFS